MRSSWFTGLKNESSAFDDVMSRSDKGQGCVAGEIGGTSSKVLMSISFFMSFCSDNFYSRIVEIIAK